MTYETHKTNEAHRHSGGFASLAVYWLAKEIYYLNYIFCERYVSHQAYGSYRTYDQMIQAARSGKQDLVEGSLELSTEGNLKLSGVSRASYGELIEDYEDFLWQKGLNRWEKDDPRVLAIRQGRIDPHETHVTHQSHETYGVSFDDAEAFANLLITLCAKQGFLMDRFLKGVEKSFVEKGGFRENLFRKRAEFREKR
ncbi:four helix bundle protein [Candidatus Shapirobacteria bacterium]|nr:four helix bundle protein [Candidatus Shapirobacteria bacterium]